MRRALPLLVLAALLVPGSPLGNAPAHAGVGRSVVMSCPSGPAECWPTAFDFIPGGRGFFYVERYTGEIRRFLFEGQNDTRWGEIGNLSTEGEQGLLGVAVDPRWNRGDGFQWIYVYYTQRDPLANVIERLRRRETGGLIRDRVERIPAASGYHNGGVIDFGPDGMLYAVTGEAHDRARAQDRQDPAGKVLRMTPTGARPAGNPIPGSLAWSYGHRNSFGFGFDRRTDNLWQSENGPECEDELNRIVKGRNYGWGPGSDCPDTSEVGPNPVNPELKFTPTIAITGVTFCLGCGLGAAVQGDIVFGSHNDGRIRHAQMQDGRRSLGNPDLLYDNGEGVVGVKSGPGGAIYFSDHHGVYRLTG